MTTPGEEESIPLTEVYAPIDWSKVYVVTQVRKYYFGGQHIIDVYFDIVGLPIHIKRSLITRDSTSGQCKNLTIRAVRGYDIAFQKKSDNIKNGILTLKAFGWLSDHVDPSRMNELVKLRRAHKFSTIEKALDELSVQLIELARESERHLNSHKTRVRRVKISPQPEVTLLDK